VVTSVRVNNKCVVLLGGSATFKFIVAAPNSTVLSEDVMIKYERATALALGVSSSAVMASAGRVLLTAETIAMLLSAGFAYTETSPPILSAANGGLEITFVVELPRGSNGVTMATQIETNTFKNNLGIANNGEGRANALVREESLLGLNYHVYPPPPPAPPPVSSSPSPQSVSPSTSPPPVTPSPPPGAPSPSLPDEGSTGCAGKARELARCAMLLSVMTVWLIY